MANYINTLTNANGKPAVAVLVRMHDYYTGEHIASTYTNKWGQFSFENISEGTYDFRLYGENFTETDWIYEVHIIDAVDNSTEKDLHDNRTKFFGYSGKFYAEREDGRQPGVDFDTREAPYPDFVPRGDPDYVPPLVDPVMQTIDAKNVARNIYADPYIVASGVDDDYETSYGSNLHKMNSIQFNPGNSNPFYHTVGMFPYVKYPGEDLILIQGRWEAPGASAGAAVAAFESYILGGSDYSTVLISGAETNPGLQGAYDSGNWLEHNDDFSLAMNISGLVDYATYIVGLRGCRNVKNESRPAFIKYLTLNVGGYDSFIVSGIYSPPGDGGGSGGGGTPPTPST